MPLTDPMAAVHQYIDDFNKGDGEAMSATFAVPATMTFKVQNQQVVQNGAVFTVALRKLDDGWRIAAWAWAKGTRA